MFRDQAAESSEFSLKRYYQTSFRAGINAALNGEPKEALRRIINPVSYPRPTEARISLYDLAPSKSELAGQIVLDLSSPKLETIVRGMELPDTRFIATDILPEEVAAWQRHYDRLRGKNDPNNITFQDVDGRNLEDFDDGYFRWVYSVSVLEHVVDKNKQFGDRLVMSEIERVLMPGGVLTLTVPYDSRGFRNETKSGSVYEREADPNGKTFYQRHYDEPALQERIIEPTGLILTDKVYFGEGKIKVEEWWNKIPMRLKAPLLPFQGWVGSHLFTEVSDPKDARGVALKFVKPDTRSHETAA